MKVTYTTSALITPFYYLVPADSEALFESDATLILGFASLRRELPLRYRSDAQERRYRVELKSVANAIASAITSVTSLQDESGLLKKGVLKCNYERTERSQRSSQDD